jgi:hypothetical protein
VEWSSRSVTAGVACWQARRGARKRDGRRVHAGLPGCGGQQFWHPAGVHRCFGEGVPVVGPCRPNRPLPIYRDLPTLRVEVSGGDLVENWPEWLIARILLREAREVTEKK